MQTFWASFALLLSCGSQVQLRSLHSWDVDIYFGPKQATLPSGNFENIFDDAIEDEMPVARQISTAVPFATATVASSINIQIPTNANVSLTFGNAGVQVGLPASSTDGPQTVLTSTSVPDTFVSATADASKASGTEVEPSSTTALVSNPDLTTASTPISITLGSITETSTVLESELGFSGTTTTIADTASTDLTGAAISATIPVAATFPSTTGLAVEASTGFSLLPPTDLASSSAPLADSTESSTDLTTAATVTGFSTEISTDGSSTATPGREVTVPLSDASNGLDTTTTSDRINVAASSPSKSSRTKHTSSAPSVTAFSLPSVDLTTTSGILGSSATTSTDVSNTLFPSGKATAPLSAASERIATTTVSNRIDVASSSLPSESSETEFASSTPSSNAFTALSTDFTTASGFPGTSDGTLVEISSTSTHSGEATASLLDASEGIATTTTSNRIDVTSSSPPSKTSANGSVSRTSGFTVPTTSISAAPSVSATTVSQRRKPSRSQNKNNARVGTTMDSDSVTTSTESAVLAPTSPVAGSAPVGAADPAQYILQNYGSGFVLIPVGVRPGSAMPLPSPFPPASSVSQIAGQGPFSGLALVIPGGAAAGAVGNNVVANVEAVSGVGNGPLPTGFGPGPFYNPNTIQAGFPGPV